MSSFAGFSDADIRHLRNGGASLTVSNSNSTACRIKQRAELEPENVPVETHPNNTSAIGTQRKECENSANKVSHSNEANIQARNVKDFNDFQLKHKYMEEQNRLRREQVERALQERTKKSQKEQQRLTAIQDELNRLDLNLSNDVQILRKQIDAASCEFTDAQKRYRRVEKEFLDAKLFLQRKLEKKEMLTEHLYTIIARNEEQKAHKLQQLLLKLQSIVPETEHDILQVEQVANNV